MARFNAVPIIAAGQSAAKHQKSVIDLFRERHAVQRATAQALPSDLSSAQRRAVDRLVHRGIVRLAAKDLYYIDEDAVRDWRARQRAIAFAISVIAVGVAAALALMP